MSHREEILAKLIALAVHRKDYAEVGRLHQRARGHLPRMKFSPQGGFTRGDQVIK